MVTLSKQYGVPHKLMVLVEDCDAYDEAVLLRHFSDELAEGFGVEHFRGPRIESFAAALMQVRSWVVNRGLIWHVNSGKVEPPGISNDELNRMGE